MSAADMLDDALDLEDEEDDLKFCGGCGLHIDAEQIWCGIDPACRLHAQLEYGYEDDGEP